MPRTARIVIPGLPHHATQRGNRRQKIFFSDDDRRLYLRLMADSCRHYGVECEAYCLMTNHVHLALVPSTENGLALAVGNAHRQYSSYINRREGYTGYLMEGRFRSCVMVGRHRLNAARYIEYNPHRAGMVEDPADYPWSSAQAHLTGRDDDLVKVRPLLDVVGDWKAFLAKRPSEEEMDEIRRQLSSGLPMGPDDWVERVEKQTGRKLLLPRIKTFKLPWDDLD